MLDESEIAILLAQGGAKIVLDYLVDKGVESYGDDFERAVRNGKLEVANYCAARDGFSTKFDQSLDHLKREVALA